MYKNLLWGIVGCVGVVNLAGADGVVLEPARRIPGSSLVIPQRSPGRQKKAPFSSPLRREATCPVSWEDTWDPANVAPMKEVLALRKKFRNEEKAFQKDVDRYIALTVELAFVLRPAMLARLSAPLRASGRAKFLVAFAVRCREKWDSFSSKPKTKTVVEEMHDALLKLRDYEFLPHCGELNEGFANEIKVVADIYENLVSALRAAYADFTKPSLDHSV